MKRRKTNFDVFKEKLVKDLKPDTVCMTIMCGACPFRDRNVSGCSKCNDELVAWFKEEAK